MIARDRRFLHPVIVALGNGASLRPRPADFALSVFDIRAAGVFWCYFARRFISSYVRRQIKESNCFRFAATLPFASDRRANSAPVVGRWPYHPD